MANIFDQFDQAPTPVSPARAMPSAPAAPVVAGNPFDRFDPPAPAAPAVKDDLAGQFGAGIVKGIPNAVTGLSDLMEKGVADNLLLRNPETGRGTVETFVDAWGDLLSGKPATPLEPTKEGGYQPVSGGVIRSGLDATGLNPDKYFRPPETAGERIAELAGEGAVTSIFSPNKAQGWQKLVQAGKEMLIGAGAGAGAQAGMEVAPEWADPLVGLGAGLVAGVGTAGLVELPGAVAKGVGRTARYVEPAVANRKGIERMAGEQIAATVGDRDTALAALNGADEIVPGSRPTAFQATGDIGLGSLERALARGDDEFKRKLIERIEKQNEARVSALDAIQDSGNPALVADFFRGRMRELEDTASELYSVAEKRAKGDYEGLGERPAGEIGEQARTAIESEFKRLNTEANKLWNSIDPDGTLVVGTKPLVDSAAKIYGAISPEEMLSVSAKEKALAGIIGSYEGAIPFKRFKDLRSEISAAMREAKMTGQGTTYGRLSRLRSAIEEAVSDSIAGKMEADPSLADDFVRKARDWYETRVAGEAGDVPAARPMAAAAGSARAVPEASGEGGPASGVAAAPARDQGLSEDARPVVAPEPIAPRPAPTAGVGIEGLDPADVAVDARRFQFKGGGDEAGVTERLQGIERWDPRLAGTAMVFRDASGKNWVADGHQRFGLARRLMDEGHPPIKVNSFVLDAADGYTDAQARAIAAVKNIAEGTGTPVDAAKVLRAAKASGIDLPPLPPRSALVKDGRALAQLSDEAFGAVVNEVIPHQQAAIIGRLVADPAQQMEAVRLLSTLKPDNLRQAELVIKDMLASGTEQMTRQGGLFGAEDYASSVTLERAKIADEALKLLRQDKRTFSTLVDEADRIENQGNVLSRASNEARLSTDERAADLLTQLAFRAGPVSSELSRIARQFKAGDISASAGARAFLGTVREAVESGVDTGADVGGAGIGAQAGRGEVDPDATPRDPDTVEMFQRGAAQPTDAVIAAQKKYDAARKRDDSIGPKASLKQWMAASEARSTARDQFADALDNLPGGLTLLTDGGLGAMVTRDSITGNWRVTYFDNRGFSGHSEYKTRPEAIRGALRDGYSKYAPDAIRQAMGGDAFTLYQRGEKFGGFDTEPGIEGKPQTLIPGVAPIDDAARIAAASSKPLKGGNAPPPKGGLFDDGEREFNARQMSLFQNGSGIRNTMAERFMGAGRPVEEAVAAGELVDAFYTTMAQRLGKTVDEVQEQFPLPQVKKGEGDAGGFQQAPPPKSPEFKRWFGDSKVVDADGKPMVVYHGTAADFDAFRADQPNFFSPSKVYAERYTNPSYSASAKSAETFKSLRPRVEPVYLKLEKPFDTRLPAVRKVFENEFLNKWGNGTPLQDSGLPDWTDANDLMEFIQENGLDYDGIVLDEAANSGGGPAQISYATWKPENVKSVNNRGTWDANDPRLLFQSESGPRGSIQFDPTGGASLIKLFEKADASTALHESAHQFLHMFRQFATAPDAPANITKDWSAAKAWWEKNARDVAKDAGAGVTPEDVRKVLRDQSTGDRMKDLAIDKGLHEQWARGFEVYLREGKAPNAAMRGVFEQFKDWLTQVYQSITGMGVNLSPEIKAVFGRMLGGDGAQMIDDTAAGRFKAATAATRNIKDTFGAKPVKGIMRRPGPTYPYEMSPENVSAQIFKAGPEGAANIQNVMKAGATKDAIEAAAVLSAKRSASKEGAFDPAKFAAWRAKHTDALKQIPEIDQKLSSAALAAKTMIETGERNAKVIAEVRKTAIGKLLNVEAGADVAATIGSMLNRSDAVKAMRDLAKEAAGDPNALEGLRRAVVDHMLTRLKTPKDALRPDTFQRFLGKNAPALAQVLTPEQMSSLRAIAQDLKRASRDVRAPGGGSDTAENLAARGKYLHDKPSIIQTMIQQSIGSVATHAAASFFAPGLTNAMTWVAQTLGGTVLQSMRSAGIKRVDDLIKEAILDPELMKALLMKAPKAKNRGSALTLSQKLGNIAAMNLALGISHAQEQDDTGVERRRADQSAMSPMSGG